jgi:hypothetical protein
MSKGMLFLVCWAGFMAFVGSVLVLAMNYDRVLVAFFRLCDAPVCAEARMIAGMIYRHPEQWTASGSYTLKHPKVGEIWSGSGATGLHVEGAFGRWNPNVVERRIIFDAIAWYRTAYMKRLLTEAMAAA